MNFEVALAVIDQAVEEGVARADIPPKDKRREWAEQRRWKPEYVEYKYAQDGLK